VVNCDLGLVLSIAALEIPAGGECLVQSFTFNSTVNAILWNRLTPAFVDIDPRTFNVDCGDLDRRITAATRAIVVTHIFGSPFRSTAFWRSRAGTAPGRRRRRPRLRREFPGSAHRRPSARGLSGFQLQRNQADDLRRGGADCGGHRRGCAANQYLRAYGFQNDYVSEFVESTGSSRKSMRPRLSGRRGHRRGRRGASAQGAAIPGRARSRAGHSIPGNPSRRESDVQGFAILCPERRDDLAAALEAGGIQTKKYFRPVHGMPAFRRFQSPSDDLGDTIAVADAVLCLPMFNELADADVDRVSEAVLRSWAPVIGSPRRGSRSGVWSGVSRRIPRSRSSASSSRPGTGPSF
jgi:hypothetical protein